ncbi:MAG: C39 family peptidase [Chthoniobacteraceae bacterium]
MKPLRLLPIALVVVAAHAEADEKFSFDSVLSQPDLWTIDQDAFQKATAGLPLRWTSATRDSARAAQREGMTLFGRQIYEFIARFEGGKPNLISANFFARGDAGELTESQWQSLLVGTVEAITKATGLKHTVRGKDATSAVKAEGLVWQTAKSQYLLEYSFTKEVKSRQIPFRAEFARLEVRPVEKRVTMLTTASATRPRFNAAQHVKKEATGDVWLHDVPMVDQGQKGYCVVASAERVMRYYGGDVDSNELAQIANSSAAGGTSMSAMTESLKKVAARLKVRVREHEKLDVKTILDLMRDYNRSAKRAKAPEIPDQGQMLDVAEIYGAMKADVLKDARTKNRADVSRFQRDVQSHIDSGIPLLWSVHLGLIQEEEIKQASGGHMRLIIGYNVKTQEIIYSDSWGAGHERKRMKFDDAWTITTALVTIEPT